MMMCNLPYIHKSQNWSKGKTLLDPATYVVG